MNHNGGNDMTKKRRQYTEAGGLVEYRNGRESSWRTGARLFTQSFKGVPSAASPRTSIFNSSQRPGAFLSNGPGIGTPI